jgi:tetratricopeptide (TPR) repeat protein
VLLTQVARALGLQEKYDFATALLESVPEDLPEIRVRVLLERGRLLNSAGDAAGARPLFEAAFAAAAESGFEFLAIDALHMVAIVAAPEEQDDLNRRALDLASSATDPRASQWRASLLNNLGWSAFERGALDDALTLFEEAVAEREAQDKPGELLIARWCVARTLREMGRAGEALAIQESLAAELHASGKSDQFVDEELTALRAGTAGAAGSGQTSTTPEPGTG